MNDSHDVFSGTEISDNPTDVPPETGTKTGHNQLHVFFTKPTFHKDDALFQYEMGEERIEMVFNSMDVASWVLGGGE